MTALLTAALAALAAAAAAFFDRWARRHESLLLADLAERTHPYT